MITRLGRMGWDGAAAAAGILMMNTAIGLDWIGLESDRWVDLEGYVWAVIVISDDVMWKSFSIFMFVVILDCVWVGKALDGL